MGSTCFHYVVKLVKILTKIIYVFSFMSDSKDEEEMSKTFCLVFIIMWLGGSIITLNSILLGAKM